MTQSKEIFSRLKTLFPNFRDLKFLHRIAMVLVLLTISAAVIIAGYFGTQSILNEAENLEREVVELVETIGEIKAGILELRRQEKNFLLRKDPKYLDAHRSGVQAVNGHITDLGNMLENLLTDDNESGNSTDNESAILDSQNIISSLTDVGIKYATLFNAVAESHITFGLRFDNGLKGELTYELDALEVSTIKSSNNNQTLIISVLRLREAQAEYMAFPSKNAVAIVNSEIEYLRELAAEETLSYEARQTITESIDRYQNKWPKILTIVSSIATTETAFTVIANQIDPIIEQAYQFVTKVRLEKKARFEQKRTYSDIRFFLILLVIFIIL